MFIWQKQGQRIDAVLIFIPSMVYCSAVFSVLKIEVSTGMSRNFTVEVFAKHINIALCSIKGTTDVYVENLPRFYQKWLHKKHKVRNCEIFACLLKRGYQGIIKIQNMGFIKRQ